MCLENLIPHAEDFEEIVNILTYLQTVNFLQGKIRLDCMPPKQFHLFSPAIEVFVFLLLFCLPPHCYSYSSVTHNSTLPQITETFH